MGSWDVDSFGNDAACDWTYELEETEDLSLVEDTLQRAVDAGSDELEIQEAEEAVAAAEVVARLKGNFGYHNAYTETVDKWVEAHPGPPSEELVTLAVQALDRVVSPPSELRDVWEEADDLDEWKASVDDLKRRVLKQ